MSFSCMGFCHLATIPAVSLVIATIKIYLRHNFHKIVYFKLILVSYYISHVKILQDEY